MKKLYFVFTILISFSAYSQFAPETDPHRGIYIDKFVKTFVDNSSIIDPSFSVLAVDTNKDGIFEKEDAILKYAAESHITYIAMFDLHRIFGRHFMVWDENLHHTVDLEDHLERFIKKAKSQYGVNQIGAIGGSESFFDSLGTFLNRHPQADIDVVNIEYEFWITCSTFPNFINILDVMYNFKENYNLTHPYNPIITEAYLAAIHYCNSSFGILPVVRTIDGCTSCAPCSTCTNPHPRKTDRALYAWLVTDPGTVNIGEQNYFEDPLTEDSTDFHPILYAESYNTGGTVDWTGIWFPLNPFNNIFTAEESYYTHWRNNPNVAFGTPRQNNVQPGGVHWFTATNMLGYLDQPQILQNSGPYCTTNTLQQVTFKYYGPIENGIPYQFWITRNSDDSLAYPAAGGRINGVSGVYQPLTSSTTQIRSINFTDTTLFPVCMLPEGNYTAHLLLNYTNNKSYQCNNRVIINHSPKIGIVSDSVFCEGEYVYLHANEPATSFTWYKNGIQLQASNAFLKVTSDGDYSCSISGGICPGTTDIVHIHVKPNPPVNVNALCNADGTATLKTNISALGSSTLAGPGGLIYRWNTGDTTEQLIVTPPTTNTTYRVNVTNPYNGCTRTAQLIIKSPLVAPYPSSITINNQPSSSCSSDGSLTANISAFGAPNNYQWSNGECTKTISGLPYGTYIVAMNVWAAGCTSYDTVTIGTPPSNSPTVTPTIQPTTCSNSANGSIQLSVSGGNPPFNYHWLNFPEDSIHNPFNKDQNWLFPGIYTVRIADAGGCLFDHTFTVNSNNSLPHIQAITTTSVTGCPNSSNGSATVSQVNGGTQPYAYAWDDSQQQTGPTATSLPAGSVKVFVTDANGCVTEAIASIPSDELPIHIHRLDSSVNTTSCPGANDGIIYLNIEGGNIPYTVSSPWTADSNFAMQSNLPGGVYPVQITDVNGCTTIDSFIVNDAAPLQLFVTPAKASCVGCQDGSFSVSFAGGTTPFQITWQPANGILNGNLVSGLPGGIYSICVTDIFGCNTCISDTIKESTQGIYSLDQSFAIVVKPNPFSDYTSIEINNRKLFSGSYILTDVSNVLVQYSKISSSKFMIRQENLVPGIYFLKIMDEGMNVIGIKKLIVLKK